MGGLCLVDIAIGTAGHSRFCRGNNTTCAWHLGPWRADHENGAGVTLDYQAILQQIWEPVDDESAAPYTKPAEGGGYPRFNYRLYAIRTSSFLPYGKTTRSRRFRAA